MNKHGLTLMEVIVAALILAVTVGGVLYIFTTEKGVVARTGRRVEAMDFTRQTLEELKNAVTAGGTNAWPGGDLAQTDAAWGDPGNWNSWTGLPTDSNLGSKFIGEGRKYRVQNIDADITFDSDGDGDPANDVDYKQVQVVVDWEEPSLEE